MYKFYNPNPLGLMTAGDCVPRALSKLFGQTWDRTYTDLALQGYVQGTMPSANSVHQTYLEQRGYYMHPLSNDCPNCMTVAEFSERFPRGHYLLSTDGHVVALIDGIYYDSFDSGGEVVNYYFSKKGEKI